jgi:hypothetical protein
MSDDVFHCPTEVERLTATIGDHCRFVLLLLLLVIEMDVELFIVLP